MIKWLTEKCKGKTPVSQVKGGQSRGKLGKIYAVHLQQLSGSTTYRFSGNQDGGHIAAEYKQSINRMLSPSDINRVIFKMLCGKSALSTCSPEGYHFWLKNTHLTRSRQIKKKLSPSPLHPPPTIH